MDATLRRLDLNRFDLLVWGALLVLGAATGLLLLRGDQVGVRIEEPYPTPGSLDVSTQTEIRLTFDAPMEKAGVESRFHIAPPAAGELSWRGRTLIWRPREPLTDDTRYRVTLAAGARSAQGRRVKRDFVWAFETGHPRVIYMSLGEVSQLYAIQRDGRSARQLTRFEDGSSVWDYAISPDGSRVAFGLLRPDGSAVDLWLVGADGSAPRRLLTCDGAQCSGVTWSPDGRRLAYERRDLNVELGSVGVGPGPSRVWLLDLRSGQTQRLFQDSQMLGYAPRWSPDQSRLGYFDPAGGVRIVELDSMDSQLIPNQLGEMGSWSPDGRSLILVDVVVSGERYTSYLFRADLETGTTRNLSGEESGPSDHAPVWSPTGEWLAFGRKALADGTPTAGQQLWLVRPDGREAHPLVTDPEAHLGGVAWSPDGRALAYVRFRLMQADARPEVWFVSLDGGEPVRLAGEATLPGWLP